MHTLNHSILIRADKESVFSVLKDFARYPALMHYVKSVEIKFNSANEVISEWDLDVEGADINWLERDVIDPRNLEIAFTMISGDYGAYYGKWKVYPSGERTELSVQLFVDWDIPSFEKVIGPILEQKMKRVIRGMLAAIKLHCQRQATHGTAVLAENRPKKQVTAESPNFAFVIHPLDVGLVSIAFGEPNLMSKKLSLIKKAFEWLPSFQCSDVTGVCSKEGTQLRGSLLYCALLPDQILSLDDRFVMERVISAGRIAQKRGAKILGLGAYAAQIGKKGVAIGRALEIPVTTGTHYTIYIAIQSVLSAAERIGLKIDHCHVTVIGATGAIGRVCSYFFADRVARLTLVARNALRLQNFVRELKHSSKAEIGIETDVKTAINESDIAIMATTTPLPLVDISELRPGLVVCDISRPRNISNFARRFRDDVLVVDGGIVQPPGEDVDFNFYFGLPKGLSYACMAETMILALERKYESYSLGGEVSLEKVKEIGSLGDKHGFKLAKIISFDQEVPDEVIANLSKVNKVFL